MSLERAEELSLNYLTQSSNPLVTLNTLLEHCQRDKACGSLGITEFSGFLRQHELIEVVDGPAMDEEVNVFEFAQAGFDMGPRAILKSRIPPPAELRKMMGEQLIAMGDALDKALAQAEGGDDEARKEELRCAVERAKAIKEKLRELL